MNHLFLALADALADADSLRLRSENSSLYCLVAYQML